MKKLGAARAGVFVGIEPVVGALLAVAGLGESIDVTAIIGGSFILTTTWLISRSKRTTT